MLKKQKMCSESRTQLSDILVHLKSNNACSNRVPYHIQQWLGSSYILCVAVSIYNLNRIIIAATNITKLLQLVSKMLTKYCRCSLESANYNSQCAERVSWSQQNNSNNLQVERNNHQHQQHNNSIDSNNDNICGTSVN